MVAIFYGKESFFNAEEISDVESIDGTTWNVWLKSGRCVQVNKEVYDKIIAFISLWKKFE